MVSDVGGPRQSRDRRRARGLVAVLVSALVVGCAGSESGPDAGGGVPRDGGVLRDGGPLRDGGLLRDGGRAEDGGGTSIDPTCATNGCLRSVALLATATKAELVAAVDPNVAVENGYAVYLVRFATDGDESFATVTIPDVAPPPAGFHVVANNHGTSGVDDPCRLSGTVFGAGLAGLFGARRMIGVAVDYPGLGTPGLHPYLVARSEGASALDGLRAASQLAERLGVPVSGRSAMVGLSQGGHATIAAAALHAEYAPELDIAAFSATAPASVWASQWTNAANLEGPHHAFFAMAFFTWADHYGWPSAPIFATPLRAILETYCGSAANGAPTLFTEIPSDPNALYHPDFLRAFATLDWAGYEHVHDAFEANALAPYAQTAPLRIYQGEADTVVLPSATTEVVEALRRGGVVVEYELVPGGTHTDVAWGFLAFEERRTAASIAWLREQLASGR